MYDATSIKFSTNYHKIKETIYSPSRYITVRPLLSLSFNPLFFPHAIFTAKMQILCPVTQGEQPICSRTGDASSPPCRSLHFVGDGQLPSPCIPLRRAQDRLIRWTAATIYASLSGEFNRSFDELMILFLLPFVTIQTYIAAISTSGFSKWRSPDPVKVISTIP